MRFLEPLPSIVVAAPDCDKLLTLAEQIRGRQPAVAEMIEAELTRATVVEASAVERSVATMRSEVVFSYDGSRDRHRFVLSWPGEADLASGKLSIATPVGAALIGLREGQSIAWRTTAGEERRIVLHEVARRPAPARPPDA